MEALETVGADPGVVQRDVASGVGHDIDVKVGADAAVDANPRPDEAFLGLPAEEERSGRLSAGRTAGSAGGQGSTWCDPTTASGLAWRTMMRS